MAHEIFSHLTPLEDDVADALTKLSFVWATVIRCKGIGSIPTDLEALMAKAWDQYTKEMFEKFGYMATWTPGVQLELGDVGVVKDRLFTRITSLTNLGISFNKRDDKTEELQKHASSGSVSIVFKAAGKAPAVGSVLTQAEAGFTIEFKKNKSTVYEATGCVAPMIDDQVAVGRV